MLDKIIRSSTNSQKISLTIKSLIPFVIFGLGAFGYVNISQNDLVQVVEVIGTIVSAGFVLYGLVRKIYLNIK